MNAWRTIMGWAVVAVVIWTLAIVFPISAQQDYVWMREFYHVSFTFPETYANGAPVEAGKDIMELFIEVDKGDGNGFVPFGDGSDGVPGRYDTSMVGPSVTYSLISFGQPPDQEWLWRSTSVKWVSEVVDGVPTGNLIEVFGDPIEAEVIVRQYPSKPPSVTPRPIARTDVNGDGLVDAVDIQTTINSALGIA